ncbi:hypothetical protein AB0I28_33550 [Phytomonospora sp. NPDC050363]|uniref:hypothetical protein n=1 Tax=Phytomonospora sp. NPDC050363 TaxID=3155642 RepID=UPI0034080731
MTASTPAGASEAEIAALREEVERLRGRKGKWRRGGRWVAATALFVVAAVLAGVALLAGFVRDELLDTDSYVATVAPLAHDPAVQTAVADRLTGEIVKAVDFDDLTSRTVDALKRVGAPAVLDSLVGTVADAIEGFIGTKVSQIVASDTFADAWADANRIAHTQLDAVLTGQDSEFVTTTDTTVSVDLGAFLEVVKQRLVEGGFGLAAKVPAVSIQFTVFDSPDLAKAQRLTKLLNTVATWLPWLVLVLVVAGLAAAPRRRTGLLIGGICLLVMAAILVLALPAVRTYYLNHLPSGVSPDAAAVVYDQVVAQLANAFEALLVAAVIWVVAAFVAGPSRLAGAFRGVVVHGCEWLARILGHLWPPLGRAGQAVARWYRPVQVAAVVVAVLTLVLDDRPGPSSVLWTALWTTLFVLVLEVVVRIPPPLQPESPVSSSS